MEQLYEKYSSRPNTKLERIEELMDCMNKYLQLLEKSNDNGLRWVINNYYTPLLKKVAKLLNERKEIQGKVNIIFFVERSIP